MDNYEEDPSLNPLFVFLRDPSNADLYQIVLKDKGHFLCLPRVGSLADNGLTREFLETHVLMPKSEERMFTTANNKTVRAGDGVIEAKREGGFAEDRTVRVLFDELFYDEDRSFHILCIDHPLVGGRKHHSTDAQPSVFLPNRKSFPECKEFLRSFPENSTTLRWLDMTLSEFKAVDGDRGVNWDATVGRVRQIFTTAMRQLLSANSLFKSLQGNRLQAERLGHYVESYIMGELHLKLYVEVVTAFAHDDSVLVAQVERLHESGSADALTGSESDVSIEALEPAIAHFSTLDDYKTPIEKLTCIRDTLSLILKARDRRNRESPQGIQESSAVSGDDMLSLLLQVIIQAKSVHLYSNLYYIRSFHLTPIQSNSEIGYNFATFEAAIEYLRNRAASSTNSSGTLTSEHQQSSSITALIRRASVNLPRSRSWEHHWESRGRVSIQSLSVEVPPFYASRPSSPFQDHSDTPKEDPNLLVQANGLVIQPRDSQQYIVSASRPSTSSDPEDDIPEEGFFKAVEEGDVSRVQSLVPCLSTQDQTHEQFNSDNTALISNVNVRNEQGFTALHLTALKGFPKITEILLQQGADVNAPTRHGTTALYLACQYNHIEVAQLLLRHSDTHVNFPDINRNTPLHAAASNGHLETLKLLLAHNADVSLANNRGETPLHVAARWGYASLTQALIDHHCDVNARTDTDGTTPLHLATDSGVITLLVRHGANINAEDDEGIAALHRAAHQGNADRVELLWGLGANVDARDHGQRTALHSASFAGHFSVVSFLVDTCHADLNAQSKNGNTPLHAAVSNGHLDIAVFLLQRGASITLRNKQGKLPEDMTQAESIRDIFRKYKSGRRSSIFASAATMLNHYSSPSPLVLSSPQTPQTPQTPSQSINN